VSGSEHARPVWLTQEHDDAIKGAIRVFDYAAETGLLGPEHANSQVARLLREVVAMRDAAPADPRKIVLETLKKCDDWDLNYNTLAVLRVLKAPDA
jgi:hypothetical protein